HETPDPDFPDFVADLPEDADVERDLDSMWKEYCARSNSKRFSSFYMKRNAYQRAYPATNSAEGLGAASGLLFSAYFYFIPSIAMAGLDFANEWLKDPSEYHES
ncbi:MAG: hypothetical protein SVV03_01280, partial [Candidatus Nanohaloarchaea archaeon]|nr:hypothetical protein [Candidatus Nanohaloarchaea archaeon]